MSIVPSGKTRVMVAQNFSNSLSEGFDRGPSVNQEEGPFNPKLEEPTEQNLGLETDDVMEEDVNGGVNDDISLGDDRDDQFSPKEKGKITLTSYIFEKLQSYGYPGRRLQEFKSEFVKESVSPDGVKDIEVVIPDKQYPDEKGFTGTIENEELKSISHEVNKMFGLNFNGADRAGGKWTIKFTSANLENPEDQEISRDSLDQVYGKPQKSKSDQQVGGKAQKLMGRAASTMRELIKDNKEDMVSKIKSIGE